MGHRLQLKGVFDEPDKLGKPPRQKTHGNTAEQQQRNNGLERIQFSYLQTTEEAE